MLKENKARIVLKIDVEGSESEVLRTIFASKLSAQVNQFGLKSMRVGLTKRPLTLLKKEVQQHQESWSRTTL